MKFEDDELISIYTLLWFTRLFSKEKRMISISKKCDDILFKINHYFMKKHIMLGDDLNENQ